MKRHEVNSLGIHNEQIHENLRRWEAKPSLQRIYRGFHEQIASQLCADHRGLTVELGSGIGNIKETIPHCIRTDLFPNPWIDQVENAYKLSFGDGSCANLVLFDVFHHLRYPGTALHEFWRVLRPGGRLIILDPCMSLLGVIVWGPLHFEPLGLRRGIEYYAPPKWDPAQDSYYAAQGNTYRIFFHKHHAPLWSNWRLVMRRRFAVLSYVLAGGYSRPQLYPDRALPFIQTLDRVLDRLPLVFAIRLFVTIEKPVEGGR